MLAERVAGAERWELYKLLGEPARVRLLCLVNEEELTVGELADLLDESQPNVSRHVAPLKRAELVHVRKQGTRVLIRVSDQAKRDPVVIDALAAGTELCTKDGSLRRVADVVRARDQQAREFFAKPRDGGGTVAGLPSEVPAYLSALALLLPRRKLAIDVGTGHGALLDVIAPVFERVIAVDREEAQLDRARIRLAARRYDNVELTLGELDDVARSKRVKQLGGADVVFVSRFLHHAPRPAATVEQLASLLAPGGTLLIIDYEAHEDEALRKEQADLWLGFSKKELTKFAHDAGLDVVGTRSVAPEHCGSGPDAHVGWQILAARKTAER